MGIFSWLFGKQDKPVAPHVSVSRSDDIDAVMARMRKVQISNMYDEEYGLQAQMRSERNVKKEPQLEEDALERGATEIQLRVDTELARIQKKQEEAEAAERARAEREKSEGEKNVRYSISSSYSGDSGGRYSITSAYDPISAAVDRQRSFGRMLMRYVNEHCGGDATVCYQRAGVSRQLYSQIISNLSKSVTKRTALQLCIGLKLDKEQASLFLSYAGYAFSPSSFEDATFAWCLENGVYSIVDVNTLLVRFGCKPISVN